MSTNHTPLVIALDTGTSSTRALLFGADGHAVGKAAQCPYEQTTTIDGGVECDADMLFDLTVRCLDEVHGRLCDDDKVIAVAMSCFWHSLVAVDGSGRAISPLYSWADNRSAPWPPPLRATLDEGQRMTHYRRAFEILRDEVPGIGLFQDSQIYLAKKELKWTPTANEAFFVMDMKWAP